MKGVAVVEPEGGTDEPEEKAEVDRVAAETVDAMGDERGCRLKFKGVDRCFRISKGEDAD